MIIRPDPIPNLAQRALELQAINLPGAELSFRRGKDLSYCFQISPGMFGRLYKCLLKVKPDGKRPDLIVLKPDLSVLASGRKIPHIYPHAGQGTKLCLWWPKAREWVPQMRFEETYLPWTAEWLYYFEDWLRTDDWAGGGVHPDVQPKRWSHQRRIA